MVGGYPGAYLVHAVCTLSVDWVLPDEFDQVQCDTGFIVVRHGCRRFTAVPWFIKVRSEDGNDHQ